jgi:protein FrlC
VIWGVEQDQAWEWSRECLVEIAQYAKGKGITLAVEPTPSDSNLIETADDAIKLMRESKLENVKLMFDTIHVFNRGDNIEDYVDRMGKDLVHLHISDVDRMPPGTTNDFRFLVDALKAIKFDGYLTMEIGIGSMGRKVDANVFARKALEYMRSIM